MPILLVLLLTGPTVLAGHASDPEDLRWLLEVRDASDVPSQGATWAGADVVRSLPRVNAFAVNADAGFGERVRDVANVTYVAPDIVVEPAAVVNDPRWPDQWAPRLVTADSVWPATMGSTDVTVCIADTGARTTHDDLEGMHWVDAYDFGQDDEDVWDSDGHGTSALGIIAAVANNGRGIAGLAQVGVMVAKVSTSGRLIYESDLTSAILWCADGGANVMSISLGANTYSTSNKNALKYAQQKGMLMFASAGNDGCSSCVGYPAAHGEVVAVGCVDGGSNLCSFSSRGPQVELVAPGLDVITTCWGSDNQYCHFSGTSASAPHAAGVAALVWSRDPDLRASLIRQTLRDTARDLGPTGRDTSYGFGLVDAREVYAALGEQLPQVPVVSWTFDTGAAPGWTLTAFWRVEGECGPSASGAFHLGYNRAILCDHSYFLGSDGYATAAVDLTGASQATLEFSHMWDLPPEGPAFDELNVQVRAIGGSWTTLESWSASDPVPSDHVDEAYRIDAFAGGPMEIRFHYAALGPFAPGPGWLVDDVTVLAGYPIIP